MAPKSDKKDATSGSSAPPQPASEQTGEDEFETVNDDRFQGPIAHFIDENPYPRPAAAPTQPGFYSLQDERLVRSLPPGRANFFEAETLAIGLSYLYDARVHCRNCGLDVIADYLDGIYNIFDTRRSEIAVRMLQPGNESLLEAVSIRRRGLAPGMNLDPATAALFQDYTDRRVTAGISRAVAASAPKDAMNKKSTHPAHPKQPSQPSAGLVVKTAAPVAAPASSDGSDIAS